jgi:Protein of unknown function (DUF3618)
MTMHRDESGTDPGSKSAAEIEREVRQSRAEVERTLDQIQERLSPGQLLDQAVGQLRGGDGEFMRNLGDSVRSNPLPVTLVGVGLAWMMLAGGRNGGKSRVPDWERDDWERDDWDDLAYDPYAEPEYAAGSLYEKGAVDPTFTSEYATSRGIGDRVSEVREHLRISGRCSPAERGASRQPL